MSKIILTSLVCVGVTVQIILFVLMRRAGWQKDSQQQAKMALWASITFFFVLLLLVFNPVIHGFSRSIILFAVPIGMLSVILNLRRFNNQSRGYTPRR